MLALWILQRSLDPNKQLKRAQLALTLQARTHQLKKTYCPHITPQVLREAHILVWKLIHNALSIKLSNMQVCSLCLPLHHNVHTFKDNKLPLCRRSKSRGDRRRRLKIAYS